MSKASKAGKVGRGIGKTIKWILLSFCLIVVIFIIIAIASVGNAVNNSTSNASHVTVAKYAAIHDGMTITQVESLIGVKPDSTTSSVIDSTTYTEIYYGTLSTKGTYDFSFVNNRLQTKAIFGQ